MKNCFVTVLVTLYLSFAFDKLDQAILLSGFDNVFELSGAALEWVASYLTNHYYELDRDADHSDPVLLETFYATT